MEIKVLGSVSPFCRLNRNCPGFLVTENKTKILLDCGNGCLGMLDPMKDLENLVVIITHLHHDHYGDLTSLANMSYVQHKLGYLKNKVKVYLPKDTRYEKVEKVDYDYLVCDTIENLYLKGIKASYMDIHSYDGYKPIVLDNQDIRIETKYTMHDVPCYAIRIDSNNKTLVYSADTGYRENFFKKFAQDADLFICESSFLREQEYNNFNNHHHLCAYQAAMYAKESNVGELMLTHFYPTINKNLYLEEAKETFENTILAEEGMVKKIGERL